MSEQLTKWIIVSAVVAVIIVWRVVLRSAERARREHFERLAKHFGADMKMIGEAGLSFVTEIDDRSFEIRDGYSGGGIGSEAPATRYVTFSTSLRGRSWDLHDVKINPQPVIVEEFGMRLPDGWLNDDVRAAIMAFSSGFRPQILIEGGHLVYRTMAAIREFSPELLDDHLRKQVVLARALER